MIRQQKQYKHVSLFAALALVAFYSMPTTFAQGAITPNYKEADLRQIVEAVAAVTVRLRISLKNHFDWFTTR